MSRFPSEVTLFFQSMYCSIDLIQEVCSAQHLMFIATVSLQPPHTALDVTAQQLRHKIQQQYNDDESAMLVLRIWRGSARWWNFNRTSYSNADVASLAIKEVSGYIAASLILDAVSSEVIVPQLLYFSHANIPASKQHPDLMSPWAIFSFHGELSHYFHQQHHQRKKYHDQGTFAKQMVKVRHEFGFNEPHPRHGRVSVDRALPYALKILDEVVLPIHYHLFHRHYNLVNQDDLSPLIKTLSNKHGQAHDYHSMIQDCKEVAQRLIILNITPINGSSASSRSSQELDCQLRDIDDDKRLLWQKNIFQQCIQQLELEYREVRLPPSHLPPVLCHCDLQPQNLIFWTEEPPWSASESTSLDIPNVACILDWEEASWADPRFELILLCRKVCANMEQATSVWIYYVNRVAAWASAHGIGSMDVGRIEPWLKLEAVHSLAILLLQTQNLSGRGAQWEDKANLLSKMDREFSRLTTLGWEFCKPLQEH